MNFSNWLIG